MAAGDVVDAAVVLGAVVPADGDPIASGRGTCVDRENAAAATAIPDPEFAGLQKRWSCQKRTAPPKSWLAATVNAGCQRIS